MCRPVRQTQGSSTKSIIEQTQRVARPVMTMAYGERSNWSQVMSQLVWYHQHFKPGGPSLWLEGSKRPSFSILMFIRDLRIRIRIRNLQFWNSTSTPILDIVLNPIEVLVRCTLAIKKLLADRISPPSSHKIYFYKSSTDNTACSWANAASSFTNSSNTTAL